MCFTHSHYVLLFFHKNNKYNLLFKLMFFFIVFVDCFFREIVQPLLKQCVIHKETKDNKVQQTSVIITASRHRPEMIVVNTFCKYVEQNFLSFSTSCVSLANNALAVSI